MLKLSPVTAEVTLILPVAVVQVGCTMLNNGAAGFTGIALINTLEEAKEIHLAAFVTLNVNVPEGIPLMVAVVVFPVVVIPPGLRVTIQLPDGKPLNTTEPVDMVQLGWVTAATDGACGLIGRAFIVILTAGEIQPAAFLAVKL